ncbi:MAG: sugar ABC transporter substrate-binding protein [Opitutae bacterium]|mgnify:CR=1 FL=1|nr:sugar ABC transporter substrate-binding protein [Opitutae bacterium]|tara:strand:+ start:4283 stop:5266 length:984 start_codon:yes stop_codon:yes gene_type:complete
MKYSNLLYIKNKLLGIFAGAVLFCLLGCGGDGGGSAAKGVIAYTPQTLSNPFFSVIAENIRAEAEKNGYDFLVVDPDMDVKKQSDQIDDFIAKNVVAIVLVPVDRMSIGPAVKEANAAGIPVFTVDAKCAAEGAKIEGHVGTDNFQGGELAGQAMIQALGEEGGKVLVLDLKKANSCVLRVDGFKKVINAYNEVRASGKIEIVAELDGNGDRTKGYESTSAALQAHEDLAAVFAINDPSALGAYTAVKEANRQDQIKIIGFDGMPDGKKAIKNGQIYADPIQHPDKMGIQIVELIVKYQAGESFPKETLLPATLYTKSDADQDPDLK